MMRKIQLINNGWKFHFKEEPPINIDLPHTWNAVDGQDGGNDYYRGECKYTKQFKRPHYSENECVFLEFRGVNASAHVTLNGREVAVHHGGYSTFFADITEYMKDTNELTVLVDNSINDTVYPQKADFTFYGGIYRDVYLVVMNKVHFDLMPDIMITAKATGDVNIRSFAGTGDIRIVIKDANGIAVCEGEGTDCDLKIQNVHLWDGINDPYLYSCEATLYVDGKACDSITKSFGVREFYVDPEKGFFLNGKSYPLRGVCRHQDHKGIGNALTRAHHECDIDMIREVGANTIRLAHYQHDQYFYDLCDRYGFVVWAEIPYISEHMENGRANTLSQMKELIYQNYNHPSICVWGISNEITISTKNKKDMLDNHRELNDLVHRLDPTRPTTLACYAVCGPFNKVAHITDLVSWNLYLGWYVPGLFLNDLWIDFFHAVYPKRPLGYSEYGCEAMTNLHSSHPHRGDQTEEYQAIYHEYLLKCFEKRPFMWATHVWNMFDFAADARNQGGEPGMNHKGLVTFDRKIKKDSFYLYKAYWTKTPFVHICSKRYVNRTDKITLVKVYSNCKNVSLYVNGKLFSTLEGDKIFKFRVPLEGTVEFKALSDGCEDCATIKKVASRDPSYKLKKDGGKGNNWV